jgi:hypothetical protein
MMPCACLGKCANSLNGRRDIIYVAPSRMLFLVFLFYCLLEGGGDMCLREAFSCMVPGFLALGKSTHFSDPIFLLVVLLLLLIIIIIMSRLA